MTAPATTARPGTATGGRADGPGRRLRLPTRALGPLTVLGVLLALELVSRTELLPSRYFPPVSQMLGALAGEVVTVAFWQALGETLQGWALGLGLAAVLAVPLGILAGSSFLFYRSIRTVVEFLRPIPSVALIPLAILVYGIGLESKVFLAAFAAFWPLLMQTIYGVQDVEPVATDTARSFGFPARTRLLVVTLPSAAPYVATGLRISSSVALILAVTAELVIGSPGLGQAINVARSGGAVDLMYALIAVSGILGWLLNGILARLERRALRWHPSHRTGVPA